MNLLAERCRVVLVRPTIAANLGAAARAMHNFGLTQLVLAAPVASPTDEQARQLATHGEPILDQARIVGSLAEAVADCQLVVGTSARTAGLIRGGSVTTPRAFMPTFLEAAQTGPVALVFGPETTGLTNEDVTRCHHLLTIPASPTYPVLNLAQSVVICLYELSLAAQERLLAPSSFATEADSNPPMAPADHATQDRMFQHLEQALRDIHFLWDERAPVQMNALRHLLHRARLTAMEAGLLHGIARQLQWYARTYGPQVE
jgi:tRNA/rRNA methyltransferase